MKACGLDSTGWSVVDRASVNADALLSMTSNGQSVDSSLGPLEKSRMEKWFKSQEGALRVCRFSPLVPECEASNSFVDFEFESGHWLPRGALTVVCTGDPIH